MKLSDNEKTFVKAIIDNESNIKNSIQYLKETFDIDATIDSEEFLITLSKKNINESYAENMIMAKKYLNDVFPNEMYTIIY
jgi:hypothetical protein